MKVLLLNDGTYGCGLENVNYPVEVAAETERDAPGCITVIGSELIRIGGDPDEYDPDYHYFFTEEEFEPA